MWCLLRVLEQLDIVIDWNTTVESGTSDLLEVLGESIELLLDLVGKLSSVSEDQGSSWLWIILIDLVQDRKNENCSLTHTRDSLAEDVLS